MKRYVIFIAYEPGADWESMPEEERAAFYESHGAFEAYVEEHGKHHGSAALDDTDTATTMRRDGETWIATEGPFAETAEMIGGYYDVELPDLDAAMAAARLLHPSYTLEIRPTVTIT